MINLRILSNSDRRAALFITVTSLLYAIALLRSDRLYIDDLGRTLSGRVDWSSLGRPLGDVLVFLFNLGPLQPDTSPLPQICSITLMSMAAWFVYCRLREDSWRSGVSAVSAIMLLLNPFLLENMSYRFDGLPMMLGIFLSVLPFTFRPSVYGFRHYLIVFVCLVSALMLYQASVNVFLSLLPVFAFSATAGRKIRFADTPKLLFAYLAPLVVACATYFILARFLLTRAYALQQMQAVSANSSLASHAIENGRRIFDFLYSSFPGALGILMAGMLLLSFVSVVVFAFSLSRQDNTGEWIGRIAFCATPPLALLAIGGPLLFLTLPFILPRLLVGFGGALAFIVLASAAILGFWLERTRLSEKFKTVLPLTPAATLLFVLMSLAFSYGALEEALDDQETQIAATVAGALIQAGVADEGPLVVDGVEPYPLRIRRTVEHFPVLQSLAPRHLNNGWTWGVVLLNIHGLHFSDATQDVRGRALAEVQTPELKPFYQDRTLSLFKTKAAVVLKFVQPSR